MGNIVRPTVIVLIAITIISIIIYGAKTRSSMNAVEENYQQNAVVIAKNKDWDSADYLRFSHLGDVLSDTDFNWLMSELSGHLPDGCNPVVVYPFILGKLIDAHLTPEQVMEAKSAVLPLLNMNAPDDKIGLIPEDACEFFERYNDQSAISQLLVLANSPHSFVNYHAARALYAMGYKITVPPRPRKPT